MVRLLILVALTSMLVVMASMLLISSPPVYAESPTVHVVAWGETLYSIARIYGIAPQTIASMNGMSVNSWVYAGQQLSIPGNNSRSDSSTTPSGYYTVRAGDTLFSIASRFGIGVESLAIINDLPSAGLIYVGWSLKVPVDPNTSSPSPAAPTTSTRVHIVQAGEYLNRIALRYGTTVQAIMLSNNLPNDWIIYPGERLIIPTTQDQPPVPVPVVASTDIRVSNIPLYRQQQALTCEEASVAMATRGAVSEAQLLAAMPRSDNPFLGIRGKTNSSYYGGLTDYGVYAHAVQKGLNKLGVKSELLYGQGYDDFKDALLLHLRAGRPIVWWHTWHDTFQVPVSIRTSDGAIVKLVPYEHAGVIVASNERGVSYDDPYDATVRFVSWADHRRVSGYFNNMALVIY